MNKLHEETVIQILQILNTQATRLPRQANTLPSNETIGAMAFLLAGPKESTPFCIEQVTDTFRKLCGRHVINREAPKHGIYEDESSPIT